MQSFSMSHNLVRIIHYSLYWAAWYIVSIEYKVDVIFPWFVGNKRYIVPTRRSRAHVDRDIPRGAPALNGKLP